MNAPRKLSLVAGAAVAALSLMAGPALASETDTGSQSVVLAVEDAPADDVAPADDDGDHRITMADTPRDRFGLILLGVLFVGGGVAFMNGRKQLKGERDKASGEFRWR